MRCAVADQPCLLSSGWLEAQRCCACVRVRVRVRVCVRVRVYVCVYVCVRVCGCDTISCAAPITAAPGKPAPAFISEACFKLAKSTRSPTSFRSPAMVQRSIKNIYLVFENKIIKGCVESNPAVSRSIISRNTPRPALFSSFCRHERTRWRRCSRCGFRRDRRDRRRRSSPWPPNSVARTAEPPECLTIGQTAGPTR